MARLKGKSLRRQKKKLQKIRKHDLRIQKVGEPTEPYPKNI